MTAPPASIVIVSRDRPAALARCLTGVGQLDYPAFEIVVVADSATLASLPAALAGRIKVAPCDLPNIAVARNIGIGLASGVIVAFIDDDAVPEPGWLAHLGAVLADSAVAAAGGAVRGRNGISFQWRGSMVDADARRRPLPEGDAPVIVTQRPGLAVKTEGTCMAFRRDTLVAAGGFDPAFRFYLDETDLNLRLAATGARAAHVPLAEVHHGFAPSAARRADRVPLSLHDVGASLALFLRRHRGQADPARLAEERIERRRALVGHMVAGRIEPRDVGRILATLDAGWAEGAARTLSGPVAIPDPPPFLPFAHDPPLHGLRILSGRPSQARALRAAARAAVAGGERAAVYILSTTARYHRRVFDDGGFWVQTGGLFGRSDRGDPLVRWWRRTDRLQREVARVMRQRRGPADMRHGDAADATFSGHSRDG